MKKNGDRLTVTICSDVNGAITNNIEVNEIVGLLK